MTEQLQHISRGVLFLGVFQILAFAILCMYLQSTNLRLKRIEERQIEAGSLSLKKDYSKFLKDAHPLLFYYSQLK